jgi:hypothetical protein
MSFSKSVFLHGVNKLKVDYFYQQMHQDKFVTVFFIERVPSFNKENSDKLVLVHLLVEIINYTKTHGEYKVKLKVVNKQNHNQYVCMGVSITNQKRRYCRTSTMSTEQDIVYYWRIYFGQLKF